jgi:phosphoribosyl 1,2-cyclic phosphate phosphodiesterase
MADWRIVLTGTGTSHGNPPWGVPGWWSTDPRDLRRRSGAVLLGPDGAVVLIDCGPDLMHQMRDPFRTWDGRSYPADAVVRCDAVLLTHDHADHSHGVNDLRHLNRLMGGRPIPIYGHAGHLATVQGMVPYAFGGGEDAYHLARPCLVAVPMADGVPVSVGPLQVTACALSHGPAGRTTGFRCGGLGYLTDLKELPEEAAALLHGLEVLVLDMLRAEPHPTHLCWAEAQAIMSRLLPRRTILTHMGPEVRHADWVHRLPADVIMACDGHVEPFHA